MQKNLQGLGSSALVFIASPLSSVAGPFLECSKIDYLNAEMDIESPMLVITSDVSLIEEFCVDPQTYLLWKADRSRKSVRRAPTGGVGSYDNIIVQVEFVHTHYTGRNRRQIC